MHNNPTAKYPVAQRVQAIILDWADELSATLGRSAEEIRKRGLNAGDFPGQGSLHIRLMDGSTLRFRNAFHTVRKSEHALAVFTEHCGYHIFPLHDAKVTRVVETALHPANE